MGVSTYGAPGGGGLKTTAFVSNLMDGSVTAGQSFSKSDFGSYTNRPALKFSVPTSKLRYYARDTAGAVDLWKNDPLVDASVNFVNVVTVRCLLNA